MKASLNVFLLTVGSIVVVGGGEGPETQEDFTYPFSSPPTFPKIVLRNKEVEATVYTPNAKSGYYRSSRFEWSSMIGQIKLLTSGVSFFGDWRKPHNPLIPGDESSVSLSVGDSTDVLCVIDFSETPLIEHGIGFAEEFGMANPPGFQPKKGTHFLKIGVGICENDRDDAPYDFNYPYKVVVPGNWSIKRRLSHHPPPHSQPRSSKHPYDGVSMRSQVNFKDHGYEYDVV
eukprot:jgi/Bigna1/141612/aug1.64_g16320